MTKIIVYRDAKFRRGKHPRKPIFSLIPETNEDAIIKIIRRMRKLKCNLSYYMEGLEGSVIMYFERGDKSVSKTVKRKSKM